MTIETCKDCVYFSITIEGCLKAIESPGPKPYIRGPMYFTPDNCPLRESESVDE